MSQLSLFQKRIQDEIPLSRALGIQLHSWDGHSLLLSAPLEPNKNHQGTGFGGSVYSAAVTAAWGLTELALWDLGLKGNVVVQSGNIDYLEPVSSDFYVNLGHSDPQVLNMMWSDLVDPFMAGAIFEPGA